MDEIFEIKRNEDIMQDEKENLVEILIRFDDLKLYKWRSIISDTRSRENPRGEVNKEEIPEVDGSVEFRQIDFLLMFLKNPLK